MLLARKGYRVLVADKARFPSDTVSTHVIWQAGLARAKKWGLLDRIAALGAPPIRTVSFSAGDVAFAGTPPPLDGIDFFIAPRRIVLDKMLVDAARGAGAEIREGCYIGEILSEQGRVTGISGRTLDGESFEEKARVVVGADGAHSMLAHAVRAEKYNTRPAVSGGYYSYWRGGPAVTDFEIYFGDGWGGALFPTNDGLTCVVGSWTAAFAGDPETGHRRFMETVPRIAEFLKDGRQVEPLAGMRELPGYFRNSWGDGWALAGDAGYHKHPLSAQGISDAFRDADFLAEAIDDGLSGRQELSKALAGYQQRRDDAVMPMYESTCMRATLALPPPEVMALFRALQHNQPEADRFFGTDAGTVPMTDFFAPDNLYRIVRDSSHAAGQP
jgi:2-polyprenyl-6-methoxyphenol hydroxylase-like FAD-dependent oxidoreductase